MVNSKRKNNLINPENAASFIPIFISSGISILIIIFFVIPQYVKSNKVASELNEFIRKKNDLDNLKDRYEIINKKFNKLTKEKEKIIELISGKSNLDTLLDRLGEIANKNNIKFVSVTPIKITKSIENNSDQNRNKNSKNIEFGIDPLLVEGTKNYLINFNFKTNFIYLLSFLREIEFQDSIILIKDINIKNIDKEIQTDQHNDLEVNLSMKIYGKL